MHNSEARNHKRGQIIVMFAIVVPVLLLATSLAIDLGFAYVTRAKLSKAVDAAALSAMRNVNLGQSQAIAAAQSAFNVNYASPAGADASTPTVSVAFANGSNNTVVNVSATAKMNTFFLRILPNLKTLNVTSTSQVTRPTLIMSIVLDRSGSMNLNGGAQALPPAVQNFLTFFDNNTDEVADVSFSSTSSIDVLIGTHFVSSINSAVNRMNFNGGTYAQAGLQDGFNQINTVTVLPAQVAVKVAVFFTDGWANMIQDRLNCSNTPLNIGGCSPPEAAVNWCNGISFIDPSTGNTRTCGATTFPSQKTGTNMPLTPAATGELNVSNDAMYRSLLVANSMRAQNIVIYSIGLGDKISQTFLQQIANDPASPTFDPTQPIGEAVFAPDPSQLQSVFETIASKIVARITQ